MRIPFWPKQRPTELVVTFTQEVDLEALAAGKPGVFAGAMTLAIACPCGDKMSGNGPWVMAKPNSLTHPYACKGCGNKVNIVYVTEVGPAAVPLVHMKPLAIKHECSECGQPYSEAQCASWLRFQRDRSEGDD
jgi:hypothetical protein